MARVRTTRKARFSAALALTGKTLKAWAAERGVSRFHLGEVVSGRRKSPALLADVDRFIASVESRAQSRISKAVA